MSRPLTPSIFIPTLFRSRLCPCGTDDTLRVELAVRSVFLEICTDGSILHDDDEAAKSRGDLENSKDHEEEQGRPFSVPATVPFLESAGVAGSGSAAAALLSTKSVALRHAYAAAVQHYQLERNWRST